MAVNLAPGLFGAGGQFFSPSGVMLSGGFINTYAAGTSTPQPTFTTTAGNAQNGNPIQLLSDGRCPQEIWLTAGIAYKFILTDSLGVLIGTYDNLVGINDITVPSANEWTTINLTPTFVNTTSFTLVGDQTGIFHTGRRVKLTETAGTVYGTVVSSSVAASITTVNVVLDSGAVVDSGLSVVAYGILDSQNVSTPFGVTLGPETDIASAATTNIGGLPSENARITGTTNITSLGTATAGIVRRCRMAGVLTLTYNATSLITPGAVSITTAAGDVFEAVSLGSGNWYVSSYIRYATIPQQGMSFVLVSRQVVSAVAVVDFTTGFNGDYDEILFQFTAITPVTDNVSLWMRYSEDSGGTFKAGATDYTYNANLLQAGASTPGNVVAGQIVIASSVGNTVADGGANGEARLYNLASTTAKKHSKSDIVNFRTGTGLENYTSQGRFTLDNNAINAVRFLLSSGNIASGTIAMYGVRKS